MKKAILGKNWFKNRITTTSKSSELTFKLKKSRRKNSRTEQIIVPDEQFEDIDLLWNEYHLDYIEDML